MSSLYKLYAIKYYRDLEQVKNNRIDAITKDLSVLTETIQDGIALSYYIHNEMAPNFLSRRMKPNEIDKLISSLFYRNAAFLWGGYQLIQSGLVDPARSNQRVVFESITIIKLLHYFPKRPQTQLLIKKLNGSITKDELREFNDKYNRLPPWMVREILYKGRKRNKIAHNYSILCGSSHPDLRGYIPSNVSFKKQDISNAFFVELSLLFSNLEALFNLYSTSILSVEVIDYFKYKQRVETLLTKKLDFSPNTIPDE